MLTQFNPQDYSTISFPGLGLSVNPPRSLELGSLSIQYYGLVIAIGLVLAVVYAMKRRKQFGLREDDILDGVLWIVPFSVLCARLYYCAFSWADYKDDPISILYIWRGGLAIYGGVIGAAIGVIIHCIIKKISLPAVLDLVALGFLIGQFIGRWGNFFNREAFGEATDTFLRMGLLNDNTGLVEYYHPTFLYESLWNCVGFIALHFLSKKRQYDGQIALGYVAWYGLGRTFIEGLRIDSLYWGSFRVSQILAAISCFTAVGMLLVLAFRRHDRQNLYVVRAQDKLAEEARLLAEAAEKKAARKAAKNAPVEAVEKSVAETAEEPAEAIAEEATEETTEETSEEAAE